MKWKGIAGVIPKNTEKLLLKKTGKKSKEKASSRTADDRSNKLSLSVVETPQSIRIETGIISAYIPRQGDFLIDNVLGCHVPMPAGHQKSAFQYLVSDTLGDACNFDTVKTLHDQLTELIEEHKEEPEPLRLEKTDVKKLLERSGAKEEHLEQFDREFEAAAGETSSLLASNVANTRTFEVKTPDVMIKVHPDRTDLVETRLIDGIPYLMIQLSDSVEVNGIPVTNKNMTPLEE